MTFRVHIQSMLHLSTSLSKQNKQHPFLRVLTSLLSPLQPWCLILGSIVLQTKGAFRTAHYILLLSIKCSVLDVLTSLRQPDVAQNLVGPGSPAPQYTAMSRNPDIAVYLCFTLNLLFFSRTDLGISSLSTDPMPTC